MDNKGIDFQKYSITELPEGEYCAVVYMDKDGAPYCAFGPYGSLENAQKNICRSARLVGVQTSRFSIVPCAKPYEEFKVR